MTVSAFSAAVTARTFDPGVDLVVDDVFNARTSTSPVLRLSSAFSSAVTATTLAGAFTLVVTNAFQTNTADGADGGTAAIGFGEGPFGQTPFGGTPGSGQILKITIDVPPIITPPADPTGPGTRPAAWTWSIGSWRTGPSVPLTRITNRRVTWRLIGRSEASFDLDGKIEEASAIDELISDVWVVRTPVPEQATCLFRGRVASTQDSGDAGGHRVSVSVGDYRAILDRRILWDPFELGPSAAPTGTIAQRFIDATQAQPGGSLGIVSRTGATVGKNHSDDVFPAGKPVGEAIDDLAEAEDGWDWDIIPDPNPRVATLYFDRYYPVRGVDQQRVLTYGDRVVSFTRSVDPAQYVNAIRGSGADLDAREFPIPIVRREASDITTRPEGRWDAQLADPNQLNLQLIIDRTNKALADGQIVIPNWVVTLRPGDWGGPADVWLGDPVVWVCRTGRLNVVESLRVTEIAASWDDNDNVTVVLSLSAVTRVERRWSLRKIDQRLQNLERR